MFFEKNRWPRIETKSTPERSKELSKLELMEKLFELGEVEIHASLELSNLAQPEKRYPSEAFREEGAPQLHEADRADQVADFATRSAHFIRNKILVDEGEQAVNNRKRALYELTNEMTELANRYDNEKRQQLETLEWKKGIEGSIADLADWAAVVVKGGVGLGEFEQKRRKHVLKKMESRYESPSEVSHKITNERINMVYSILKKAGISEDEWGDYIDSRNPFSNYLDKS